MSDPFLVIKQKYITTFAQKQRDLKGAWESKDISLLRTLLHKLAGSSGSYGFSSINVLCHQTMELLEDYESTNDEKIDHLMLSIMAALADPPSD